MNYNMNFMDCDNNANMVESEKFTTLEERKSIELQLGSLFELCYIDKICNAKLRNRYNARKEQFINDNCKVLEVEAFHGTHVKNIESIIKNGLDERLSRAGYWGAGIYLTTSCIKADQFVFGNAKDGCQLHGSHECHLCYRYMLLCQVNLGEPSYEEEPVLGQKYDWGHPPPGKNRYN